MINSFPKLLENFILIYLSKERGFSKSTISSYYASLEQYICWLYNVKGHQFARINIVSCFSKELIKEFLSYLEEAKQVSVSTRNLRKSAILSFLCYVADVEPLYMNSYLEAKSIRNKKSCKPQRDYLTIEEYITYMNCIDTDMPEGYKHYVLIHTMYETGARVSEVTGINIQDFSFGKVNSIVIFGKGSKYRRVYLNDQTAKLIKDFIRSMPAEKGPLFQSRSKTRISDSGIDYIVKKYAMLAGEKQLSFIGKKISPHTFRRTKATHMLLRGISLPVIQRFLGHESISTTEKYLELGSKAMSDAVQKVGQIIFITEEKNRKKEWENYNILSRLKSLIQ